MSGFATIQKFRRLEVTLDELGFKPIQPKHRYDNRDLVAVVPKDNESLPIYNRDAELFIGTIDELEFWLTGIQWARKYDSMLFGKKHEANRQRKEQDYRNRELVRILTQSEKNEPK